MEGDEELTERGALGQRDGGSGQRDRSTGIQRHGGGTVRDGDRAITLQVGFRYHSPGGVTRIDPFLAGLGDTWSLVGVGRSNQRLRLSIEFDSERHIAGQRGRVVSDRSEVVQGSRVSFAALHLAAEVPVNLRPRISLGAVLANCRDLPSHHCQGSTLGGPTKDLAAPADVENRDMKTVKIKLPWGTEVEVCPTDLLTEAARLEAIGKLAALPTCSATFEAQLLGSQDTGATRVVRQPGSWTTEVLGVEGETILTRLGMPGGRELVRASKAMRKIAFMMLQTGIKDRRGLPGLIKARSALAGHRDKLAELEREAPSAKLDHQISRQLGAIVKAGGRLKTAEAKRVGYEQDTQRKRLALTAKIGPALTAVGGEVDPRKWSDLITGAATITAKVARSAVRPQTPRAESGRARQ